MLLSAASIVFALLSAPQRLPVKDSKVWEGAKNSVVTIVKSGVPVGQAVLIDKSGLFLANQSAVSTPTIVARLADGRNVILDWRSTDVPTQTVLLQAEEWTPDPSAVVTLHQPGDSMEKVSVIVVLPSGPVHGELIAGNRVGVLGSSKRMFPLGEVKFEASAQSMAGAIVFDDAGHLVGLLNATLDSEETSQKRVRVPTNGYVDPQFFNGAGNQGNGGGGGGQSQSQDPIKTSALPKNDLASPNIYGPADPITGYTVGPDVLRRVVSGFLSPSHKVLHPAIGVNCQENVPKSVPGALVVLVKADSPAQRAGVQKGDLIVKMDDKPIQTQFDFARVIESKDAGDGLTIVVMRGQTAHTFKMIVGTMQKAQYVAPSSTIGLDG
jgi:S1-C subfamily serine protease